MAGLDIDFDQVESEFDSKYHLQSELERGVWKARRTEGWKDLVINCHQDDDGHVACYDLGGDDVGVFPVPPGEMPFGTWMGDKIRGSGNQAMEQLHFLDPTGCIFCTQKIGDEFVAVRTRRGYDSGDGMPATTLREISLLQSLAHRHVVRLLDVFCSPRRLTLVFELMESNLRMYMRRNGPLSPTAVNSFMKQLMLGIEYVHAVGVIHRDLKPDNLLVGEGLNLKIGGFSLARREIPGREYTHEVVTLWYRPLEILLGAKVYSLPVDMWSCGCILAEMASNRPLFAGDCEIDTIFKIFQNLGTPTEQQWKGLDNLPAFKQTFPKWSRKPWVQITEGLLSAQLGREGLDLLEGLLQYNPAERTSARTALELDYLAR